MLALTLAAALAASPAPKVKGDASLQTFLRDVWSDVDARAWDRLLTRSDDEHRATQLDGMGMSPAQYVAELLGLHTVGNSIDAAGDGVTWSDLDALQTLKAAGTIRVPREEGPVTVQGSARTTDGRTLRLELLVIPTTRGWRLSGGVG